MPWLGRVCGRGERSRGSRKGQVGEARARHGERQGAARLLAHRWEEQLWPDHSHCSAPLPLRASWLPCLTARNFRASLAQTWRARRGHPASAPRLAPAARAPPTPSRWGATPPRPCTAPRPRCRPAPRAAHSRTRSGRRRTRSGPSRWPLRTMVGGWVLPAAPVICTADGSGA